MKTSPDPSRTLNQGRPVSTTRRALLALGGLIAGGRAALAATDESPKPNTSAQARLKLAQEAMETVRAALGRGQFGPGERDPISIWSRRRMEARLDLSKTKAERVAAAREHLDEMARVEQLVNRMYQAGQVDKMARMDAEYRRWEAQSWLEREQA